MNITTEQQEWLQELINKMPPDIHKSIMQGWHDNKKIDEYMPNYFTGDLHTQAKSFVAWVEGGARPGHPH